MRLPMTISLASMELAVLAGCAVPMSAKTMTENERYLKEAQRFAHEFEEQLEPERLRDAGMTLANVLLAEEHDLKPRAQVRAKALRLWLHLLDLVDRFLDPNFDSSDVPEKLVQPPPSPDGEVLRPGADPARIADPQTRALYEKAIAANRAKTKSYRLQLQLQRLNEQLTPQAERFIRNSYSSAIPDQKDLSAAIDEVTKHSARKAQLAKLLKP
jgi:hypothetical protein